MSDVPPGAKADTALVQRRHAPLLVGATVAADGRIVRNGTVLGSLRSRLRASTDAGRGGLHDHGHGHIHAAPDGTTPEREADALAPPTTAARLDKQECLYLITYYLDNGEIISIQPLWCPSTPSGGSSPGGGSSCTADQEAIAREYENDENLSGGPWTCDKFDDAVTRASGTHGHATGYISSTLSYGRSIVRSIMAQDHSVSLSTTSDWRCPAGNASLRPNPGAKNSRHMRGRAADLTFNGYNANKHAQWFDDAGAEAKATEKLGPEEGILQPLSPGLVRGRHADGDDHHGRAAGGPGGGAGGGTH